jgi:hypothetical protein
MKVQLPELEADVEFNYSAASHGRRDSYGLLIEPDEPEELELTSVMIGTGTSAVEILGAVNDSAVHELQAQVIESLSEYQPDCIYD